MMHPSPLRAPFPYFGGKSKIAPLVWTRLGYDVPNYIEPFLGSGAMLLARPGGAGKSETVNDKDGLLANFWRAIRGAPEEVAAHADWPVNENDLHARHAWLVGQKSRITDQLEGDAEWFDAKSAGWWVWGLSCWIGSGWCSGDGSWRVIDGRLVRDAGDLPGVARQMPNVIGMGVHRIRPHLSSAKGINARRASDMVAYFQSLSARFRDVRVCSGDWSRITGPSVTVLKGVTAVFLDPPYLHSIGRDTELYAEESATIANDVREWAIERGDNQLFRIAMCGYEGEHEMPASWECVSWSAGAGYSGQRQRGDNGNRHRERVWFSPHCLRPKYEQSALW